ncbi:unnamed protein product [Notodromas monacha]|uniref:C2H2-type domain-containing protein n=1 Tax=Notodromas monacha TaxID=399045 RepID=A0A7R9BTP6_9CRUS|nr:unnamed protein product [Notodromas monacha]CAG0920016.1 unnamed protein product [Notodromas monacha]
MARRGGRRGKRRGGRGGTRGNAASREISSTEASVEGGITRGSASSVGYLHKKFKRVAAEVHDASEDDKVTPVRTRVGLSRATGAENSDPLFSGPGPSLTTRPRRQSGGPGVSAGVVVHCDRCGLRFKTKASLQKHRLLTHRIRDEGMDVPGYLRVRSNAVTISAASGTGESQNGPKRDAQPALTPTESRGAIQNVEKDSGTEPKTIYKPKFRVKHYEEPAETEEESTSVELRKNADQVVPAVSVPDAPVQKAEEEPSDVPFDLSAKRPRLDDDTSVLSKSPGNRGQWDVHESVSVKEDVLVKLRPHQFSGSTDVGFQGGLDVVSTAPRPDMLNRVERNDSPFVMSPCAIRGPPLHVPLHSMPPRHHPGITSAQAPLGSISSGTPRLLRGAADLRLRPESINPTGHPYIMSPQSPRQMHQRGSGAMLTMPTGLPHHPPPPAQMPSLRIEYPRPAEIHHALPLTIGSNKGLHREPRSSDPLKLIPDSCDARAFSLNPDPTVSVASTSNKSSVQPNEALEERITKIINNNTAIVEAHPLWSSKRYQRTRDSVSTGFVGQSPESTAHVGKFSMSKILSSKSVSPTQSKCMPIVTSGQHQRRHVTPALSATRAIQFTPLLSQSDPRFSAVEMSYVKTCGKCHAIFHNVDSFSVHTKSCVGPLIFGNGASTVDVQNRNSRPFSDVEEPGVGIDPVSASKKRRIGMDAVPRDSGDICDPSESKVGLWPKSLPMSPWMRPSGPGIHTCGSEVKIKEGTSSKTVTHIGTKLSPACTGAPTSKTESVVVAIAAKSALHSGGTIIQSAAGQSTDRPEMHPLNLDGGRGPGTENNGMISHASGALYCLDLPNLNPKFPYFLGPQFLVDKSRDLKSDKQMTSLSSSPVITSQNDRRGPEPPKAYIPGGQGGDVVDLRTSGIEAISPPSSPTVITSNEGKDQQEEHSSRFPTSSEGCSSADINKTSVSGESSPDPEDRSSAGRIADGMREKTPPPVTSAPARRPSSLTVASLVSPGPGPLAVSLSPACILMSPETPRPRRSYTQLFLNGHAYTYLGLKSNAHVTYCCVFNLQPTYVPVSATEEPHLSMYSIWQVLPPSTPDAVGLTPGEAMSLYDSSRNQSPLRRRFEPICVPTLGSGPASLYAVASLKLKTAAKKDTENEAPKLTKVSCYADRVDVSPSNAWSLCLICGGSKTVKAEPHTKPGRNKDGDDSNHWNALDLVSPCSSSARPSDSGRETGVKAEIGPGEASQSSHSVSPTAMVSASDVSTNLIAFTSRMSPVVTRSSVPSVKDGGQKDSSLSLFGITKLSKAAEREMLSQLSSTFLARTPPAEERSVCKCFAKHLSTPCGYVGSRSVTPVSTVQVATTATVKVEADESSDAEKKFASPQIPADEGQKCSGGEMDEDDDDVEEDVLSEDEDVKEDLSGEATDAVSWAQHHGDKDDLGSGDEDCDGEPIGNASVPGPLQPRSQLRVATVHSAQPTFGRVSSEEDRCVCEICGKAFLKPSQLRIHVNIHYFERPYRCESCAVSFRTRGHLQKHKKSVSHFNKLNMNLAFGAPTHDNPRPFKCADCNIAFRIHGHLAKHLRSKLHIMKLECVGKLPFGTYAEMERAGVSLNNIDTSDCENSLDSLVRVAAKLNLVATTNASQTPTTSGSAAPVAVEISK